MKTIELTKGMVAMVDDEDFDSLNQYKWSATRCGNGWYAHRKQNYKTVYMHRYIMRPEPGFEVDHIDSNGLNNQRSNLRLCTRTQNNGNQRIQPTNTSGFKGVRFYKGKWSAEISRHNRNVYLGRFDTAKDAAMAYDKAAIEYFGVFSHTNESMGLV